MLVAHLFLKPTGQPILLRGGMAADAAPFHKLEALLATGCSLEQALDLLAAGRVSSTDALMRFRAGWSPATAGFRDRHLQQDAGQGLRSAGH